MKSILVSTSLKEKLLSVSIFNLVGVGLLWLYTAIYPSISKQSASYNKIVKSLSPSVLKAFGVSSSGLNNLSSFLASKQYGLVWPLLILFLVIILAVSMITAEIEQSTMSQWLSGPVSRLNIYWSKFTAGIIWTIVSVFITVVAIIPLASLYGISVNKTYVFDTALFGGLFALAVFSLSMFVATLFSKKNKAYLPIGLLLILMFTLNIVAALNNNLDYLKYFSFFYYFNPSNLLTQGVTNNASYVMFGTVTVLGALLGAYVFKKRNVII